MTWFLCMRLWGRVCGFIYKIWAVTFQLHRQFWLLDRLGVWLIHLLIVIYREYCYFDFHNHMWNVEVIGRKSEISLSLDDHNYIIMCPNINWKMNVSTKVVLTWTLYRKIKHTHTCVKINIMIDVHANFALEWQISIGINTLIRAPNITKTRALPTLTFFLHYNHRQLHGSCVYE